MLKAICLALFLHCLFSQALAQQDSQRIIQASATPVVTAASSAGRVRFTAPNTVVQMHLQTYSGSGELVFDVTSKGNVLDWTVQDGSGVHLGTGAYLCLVTVKSISGKLSQRIGEVSVQEQQTELRTADVTQLTS